MFLLFFCLKNKYLCSRNMEESIITSVQNARVKHVVALQQKSSLRREERLFVVEGQREIEHCVACGYEMLIARAPKASSPLPNARSTI